MSISHQIMSLGGGSGGGGAAPTSLTYNGVSGAYTSGTTNSVTIPFPTATAEGDLVVLTVWTDQIQDQYTPTDWTLIGNGDTAEYPRGYSFYKVMTAADITTGSVDVTASASEQQTAIVLAFTPDNTINNVYATGFVNDKGPSALSITINTPDDETRPLIAVAMLTGRPAQSPTMTWNSADSIVTDTTTNGTRSAGYILYNTGLTNIISSHTVTSNDTGRQSMSGFYIRVD